MNRFSLRVILFFIILTGVIIAQPTIRRWEGKTAQIGDFQIVTPGNLVVGDATPTFTLDGEDGFLEGSFEVDGALVIPTGASPAATCTVGSIFMDTDETVDTNCTTTNDNSLCLCVAANTWVQLNNN